MVYDDSSMEYTPAFGVQYAPEVESDLALWAAVFRQAVIDYVEALREERVGKRTRHPRIQDPVEKHAIYDWFHSNENHPGSLVWLCDLFNQDAEHVRHSLNRQWQSLHRNRPRGKRVQQVPEEVEGEKDGE